MRPVRTSPGLAVVAAVLAVGAASAGDAVAQTAKPAPSTSGAAPRREPSSADVRVANDLYRTGLAHAKDERWEQAREAFARAYALYPQPVVLANLAGAEVRTGRIVAGVEHYRQVLKQPGGMPPAEIEVARNAMRAAEARLAHVRIVVANAQPGDRVEIDGTLLSSAALDIDYPVDPGKHVITAARAGADTARVEIAVHEGESRTVTLAPRPVPERAAAAPARGEPETRSIFRSPWFWIASAVVVVGAATAVCLGAVCRGEEPYTGNLGRVELR